MTSTRPSKPPSFSIEGTPAPRKTSFAQDKSSPSPKSRKDAAQKKLEMMEANRKKEEEEVARRKTTDESWVNRIVKELKAQREWSDKWNCLNDPKLYLGEDGPDAFPSKPMPTRWSPFNIINPPGSHPIPPPNPIDEPTFKITGNRDHYKTHRVSLHSCNPLKAGTIPQRHVSVVQTPRYTSNHVMTVGARRVREEEEAIQKQAGGYEVNGGKKDGCSLKKMPASSTLSNQRPSSSRKNPPRTTNPRTIIPTPSPSTSSPSTSPSTPTPRPTTPRQPPPSTPSTRPTTPRQPPSTPSTRPTTPRQPPTPHHDTHTPRHETQYAFPPTSNRDYGWAWSGRNNLEMFGSTSANFSREAWRRAVEAKE